MVSTESKIVIREFDEDKDVKVVGKLERNCEIGTNKKGFSNIFTNIMGDPLSRIRFYPLHVILVGNYIYNYIFPFLLLHNYLAFQIRRWKLSC